MKLNILHFCELRNMKRYTQKNSILNPKSVLVSNKERNLQLQKSFISFFFFCEAELNYFCIHIIAFLIIIQVSAKLISWGEIFAFQTKTRSKCHNLVTSQRRSRQFSNEKKKIKKSSESFKNAVQQNTNDFSYLFFLFLSLLPFPSFPPSFYVSFSIFLSFLLYLFFYLSFFLSLYFFPSFFLSLFIRRSFLSLSVVS